MEINNPLDSQQSLSLPNVISLQEISPHTSSSTTNLNNAPTPSPSSTPSPFQQYSTRQQILALFMCFYVSNVAGIVNGVLLKAFFEEAVSHMTGIVSRIAVKLASGQSGSREAMESALILFSFVSGAAVVGACCHPSRTSISRLGSPFSTKFFTHSPYPWLIILECISLLFTFFFLHYEQVILYFYILID